VAIATAALAVALAATGAATAAVDGSYAVKALVSDQAGTAPTIDANLVNPWGLAAGPTTPWWVANNHTDTSTIYTGAGGAQSLVVSVPDGPIGEVYYGGSAFLVPSGTSTAPAKFIFATESGKILGWPTPPPVATAAEVGLDRSGDGASYKGLAVVGDTLYAADFHNGRVDMIDGTWHVVTPSGAFRDPELPDGYAPFGIQNLGGLIFVTYAKQDAEAEDEVTGKGLGFVDEYDPNGVLLARVAKRGKLNAPWGLAMAPTGGFGDASGALLVGNFGNGRITAFRIGENGRWKKQGQLRDSDHKALEIDGLWALGFGNGAAAGPTTTLFFTAGPDDEAHGRFGTVTPAS